MNADDYEQRLRDEAKSRMCEYTCPMCDPERTEEWSKRKEAEIDAAFTAYADWLRLRERAERGCDRKRVQDAIDAAQDLPTCLELQSRPTSPLPRDWPPTGDRVILCESCVAQQQIAAILAAAGGAG